MRSSNSLHLMVAQLCFVSFNLWSQFHHSSNPKKYAADELEGVPKNA